MSNPFTEHPKEVGMNYFQHLLFAFKVGGTLFGCVLACIVHAFFPFLFTHTTSKTIQKLNAKIEHRTPKT